MDHLQERLERLEQQTHTLARQLRWWRGTALLLLVLGLVSWPLSGAMTQAQEEAVTPLALTLEQRVAALEQKLRFLTTFLDTSGRPLMQIAGANLRIVNGTGSTQTANGLGNLIVGYNELRNPGPNTRTGSHNVVVGRWHNFSSFGGLVTGTFNTISGAFASVSGGQTNIASGFAASVSGGQGNTASGGSSSVSGGDLNTASGVRASVSGGNGNIAQGQWASVSGGFQNGAVGNNAAVSGGQFNRASGVAACVSGGLGNAARDAWSSVSGGQANLASGDLSSVSGGGGNTAIAHSSSVSGGLHRTAPGQWSWAAGSLFQDQ